MPRLFDELTRNASLPATSLSHSSLVGEEAGGKETREEDRITIKVRRRVGRADAKRKERATLEEFPFFLIDFLLEYNCFIMC